MIKALTSLRFFFAFFVFLSHLSFLKENKHYYKIFNKFFSEGFSGVSFFFILSGFILALNYKEKFQNNSISKKKFYIARLARIYPLYFVTMLASMPAFYSGLKTLFFNIFLLQSYIPKQEYFFSYNAVSWSISDEMFFYAFFPILIIASYKFNTIIKVVICIIFISLIVLLNNILPPEKKHYFLYISPLTRIFDFILGIFLFDVCLFLKKLELNTKIYVAFEIGSLAILFLFFNFKDLFPVSYRYSIYYWLPMCLIILSSASSFISGGKETILSRLLSWKWFVYLGEISFGFYLIHNLVITYLSEYNGIMGVYLNTIPLALLMFILTLITSIFTYEKIEKPINRKIKNLFFQ